MSQTFITLLGLLLIGLLVTFYTLSNNTDQSSESPESTINDTTPPSKNINQDLFLLKNTISDAVEDAAQDDIQRAVEQRINKTK